jgi:hypothetical protein
MVSVLARYTSRYSVRALDLTLDSSMLWVGAGLAVLAAALLAFVPRLPSSDASQGFGLAAASSRITGTNRKLKAFALVQIAACFVLVASAAATMSTLLSLESARSGFDTRRVLAVDVPVLRDGRTPSQIVDTYREVIRRVREVPGVLNVAASTAVPWRDTGSFTLEFSVDGKAQAAGEKAPHAAAAVVSPGYFATLGLPLIAGRDFTDADRNGSEPVAIVSESLAKKMFPGSDALNHYVMWTDPMLRFASGPRPQNRRIIGIAPDIDNAHLVPIPVQTVYHALGQDQSIGGRLLVDARMDPYALVHSITRIVRGLNADQPVERAQTLEDIRAECSHRSGSTSRYPACSREWRC